MKVLVLNCGSSSLKFELIETSPELMKTGEDKSLGRGLVEKIAEQTSKSTFKVDGREPIVNPERVPDFDAAVNWALRMLTHPETGVIKNLKEIASVGHRIVHGGESFHEPRLVTPEVMDKLRDCYDIDPLHNPHHIKGIEVSSKYLSDIPHVLVFDTAFHSKMPATAYMYPLPYWLYKDKKIRRYGFHGTSHRYVAHKAAELLGRPLEELKLITIHLGNGSSMAAVKGGHSIDTSMGFTPLAGLAMGTRCGNIDPAIVVYLMINLRMTGEQINDLLNKDSGMLGITGLSNDMRELEDAVEQGNSKATLALDMFCYRIKKYIGSYTAIMGGVDALIFTAGIGQNSWHVRRLSCQGLEFMGIKVDEAKNDQFRGPGFIEAADSRVKILVLPTAEELLIARDTMEVTMALEKENA